MTDEDEEKVQHSDSANSIIALWMCYTSTKSPSERKLKRKKRTEFKVSPVFVPQALVQNMGCHTSIFKEAGQQHSMEVALAYQCSPFCSSVAYSQDGKSIQIHPRCSHNPAHNRHCSHCIHLYLRGKGNILIIITFFQCFLVSLN